MTKIWGFARINTEQECWAIKNKATEKMLSVFLVNSQFLSWYLHFSEVAQKSYLRLKLYLNILMQTISWCRYYIYEFIILEYCTIVGNLIIKFFKRVWHCCHRFLCRFWCSAIHRITSLMSILEIVFCIGIWIPYRRTGAIKLNGK